jgi:N-acetylglucosaminyldiphosphoundecaprenol N-acetyl-beta-D-mannosaminyltransferase
MALVTKYEYQSVEFMNVKINTVNYCDVNNIIKFALTNGQKDYICLTDVGNVISATNDAQLNTAINMSLLSLADGTPLAYYARLAGYNRIERIAGVRLMELLFAEDNRFSHFLLGDTDQVINKVINKARDINRGIDITGYSPPFREFTNEDNYDMIERIRKANPDIIWVCFGGGKQEKWMNHNIGSIKNGIMIGVGSGLRWYVGDLKIPPKIFQKLCLQWFYRLVSEYIKDPHKCGTFFMERQLLKFPSFIMNFPTELIRARRKFKTANCNIIFPNSYRDQE